MLRYQLTGSLATTGEIVFSGIVATLDLAQILSRGDSKYGLSVFWSLIPIHIDTLPPVSLFIDKL